MKRKITFFIFIIFTFRLQGVYGEVLSDWKISLKDDRQSNIQLTKIHSNWSEIRIPNSFDDMIHTQTKVIWLRKEISLDKGSQYSLLLHQINGKMEIYFNEKFLISGPLFPQGSILVSLPANLYREEGNVIAIRFQLRSPIANGIHGNVYLLETPKAIEMYYFQNLKILLNSIFLTGIGFFLFSLYIRFKKQKYYLFLSFFYLIIGISSFLNSEIILKELIFEKFFFGITMGLPIFLPVFFIRFFSLYFRKPYWLKKWDIPAISIIFIIIVFAGIINEYYAKLLNISWLFIFIFVFIYAIYIILLNLSHTISFRNIMSLIFLSYLFIIAINSLLNFNYFKGERFLYHFDVTIVLLIPAVLVVIEMIQLQRDIERKEEQFQAFDILQTKIFSYILTALKIPIKDVMDALSKTHPKKLSSDQIKNVIFNIEDLEKNLNDILELSRLEALEEPESYVEINVKDFLEAVLGKSKISCSIKVDTELTIETSLELVNSLLIRLIDFPGFGGFQHIDLVILSDEDYNIIFKFFLYNKNLNVTNRIYNILREKLPDKEGLWIQWKIIKETIRILGGHIKLKLFSKKYLYIEFSLKAKEKEIEDKSHREKKKSIPLVYLYYLDTKSEIRQDNLWNRIKEILQKRIA